MATFSGNEICPVEGGPHQSEQSLGVGREARRGTQQIVIAIAVRSSTAIVLSRLKSPMLLADSVVRGADDYPFHGNTRMGWFSAGTVKQIIQSVSIEVANDDYRCFRRIVRNPAPILSVTVGSGNPSSKLYRIWLAAALHLNVDEMIRSWAHRQLRPIGSCPEANPAERETARK